MFDFQAKYRGDCHETDLQHPDPRWMGYSVGRWEGDALVVESSGFRDAGWLDRMGHPHSSDLHLIERFRRSDVGHLEIDVTIDDPKAYSKRFTYTQRQTLIPGLCTRNPGRS